MKSSFRMISVILVGVIVLVKTSTTYSLNPECHKLPASNSSSCIHQSLLSSVHTPVRHVGFNRSDVLSGFTRHYNNRDAMMPVNFDQKQLNNASSNCANFKSGQEGVECKNWYGINTSSKNWPFKLHQMITSTQKPDRKMRISHRVVRNKKCLNKLMLTNPRYDPYATGQEMFNKIKSNETKSGSQPTENCPECAKANTGIQEMKDNHGRLYKRETFRLDRKIELLPYMFYKASDVWPVFQIPTKGYHWDGTVDNYNTDPSLDDSYSLGTLNTRNNKFTQPEDGDFDNVVNVPGHKAIHTSGEESINISELCKQLSGLSVPYADAIKSRLECHLPQTGDNSKQKQNYVNQFRGSLTRSFQLLPVNGPSQKTLEDPDVDGDTYTVLPAAYMGYPQTTTSPKKIIAKRTPDPFSNTTTSPHRLVITESGSCSHIIETRLVLIPGCVAKSVLITRCQGTCDSGTFIDWDITTEDYGPAEHCSCCGANLIKYRTLTFHCPRRTETTMDIRIGFPFRCGCRLCSSTPEITAEQPYDS